MYGSRVGATASVFQRQLSSQPALGLYRTPAGLRRDIQRPVPQKAKGEGSIEQIDIQSIPRHVYVSSNKDTRSV